MSSAHESTQTLQFACEKPAHRPERATKGAAAFDLTATEDYLARPGVTHSVSTGVAVAIPEGYFGLIAARSGLGKRCGFKIIAGVIDSDYRDDIKVMFEVTAQLTVKTGDRIAQLLIIPCYQGEPEYLNDKKDLSKPCDVHAGFGSTGVNSLQKSTNA
jgi:dUTP pyrophosphatase